MVRTVALIRKLNLSEFVPKDATVAVIKPLLPVQFRSFVIVKYSLQLAINKMSY